MQSPRIVFVPEVDGKEGVVFFCCPECEFAGEVSMGIGRERQVKCHCKKVFRMIVNGRKNAASRVKLSNGESTARIISEKIPRLVTVADRGKGGIGLCISPHLAKELVIGKEVRVQFKLSGAVHDDTFIVRSVAENRIGLQYKDGLNLTPQQRVLAAQSSRK